MNMPEQKSKNALVSIITIVFNDVNNIQETIDSVWSQSYQNIEYIVIDGGSSDGTREVVERNTDKIDFWISEIDHGIYDAINKGIKAANGDYIGLLHSGDLFNSSNVVDAIVEEFVHKNVDSVIANLDIVEPTNTDKVIRHYSGKNFKLWKLRMGIMPPHPTFYCKKGKLYIKSFFYFLLFFSRNLW